MLALYLTCVSDDHKAKAPKSYVKVTLGCNLQWSHPSKDLLDQERLQCRLASLGFRAYDVLGDGNCQFRAVAHQIYDSDKYHAAVRKQAVDFIAKCHGRYHMI